LARTRNFEETHEHHVQKAPEGNEAAGKTTDHREAVAKTLGPVLERRAEGGILDWSISCEKAQTKTSPEKLMPRGRYSPASVD
jgi:hypothetical protein